MKGRSPGSGHILEKGEVDKGIEKIVRMNNSISEDATEFVCRLDRFLKNMIDGNLQVK